tara:strand:+ start:4404 stop:4961 length:558 start_codon:yes stop_codon:yes gene_type:complete
MEDKRTMIGNGNIVGSIAISGDAKQHPNFDNTRSYVGWADWEENVCELRDQLKLKDWLFVYGIPRGGVTLSTMLSHKLGIPMVADAPGYWMLDWYHWRMRQNIPLKSECKNILVVDALIDTGNTIEYLKEQFTKLDTKEDYNFSIAVVDADPKSVDKVDYHVRLKNPKHWLVYPWELGSQELKSL